MAVSFSPPTPDWPIQRVRIYGYRSGTGTENMQFIIEIWAANYTTLFSQAYPDNIFMTVPSWVDIDIAGPKVSETFFVVLITGTTATRSGIIVGVDLSVPNRHSEVFIGKRLITDWKQARFGRPLSNETANWMIRVVGGGGILKPASTATINSSTATATTSGTTLLGMNMSTLQGIAGAAATAGAGFFGWFLKTRKRRFVSSYLMKIDSTYNEYSMDREECKKRLTDMKNEIIQLLKKGKLDEPHFKLADDKLTQYLQNLEQSR
jgi:hypothetical protein